MTKTHSYTAFTVRYGELINSPEKDLLVRNIKNNKTITCKAVWDTGAEVSGITEELAKKLELESPKSIEIAGVGVNPQWYDSYKVVLIDPDLKSELGTVEVAAVPTLGGPDFLVGMEIISKGDFAITNKDNKTILSFSTPSVRELDFERGPNSYLE